jgi:hypothetical protein
MRPANVKGKTINFTKPRGWDEKRDGACGILPVRVEAHGILNHHISAWKPGAEELALLNSGGVVELCCVGIQPPVCVSVVEAEPEAAAPVEPRPIGEQDLL